MGASVFVTELGDEIRLDTGYESQFEAKFVRRDRPSELYGRQYAQPAPPLGFGAFAYKHYEACWVFDSFRARAIPLAFDSQLDIGSGFAAMPRIVHVRNYAREVTALDLFPYGVSALSNGRVRAMLAGLAAAGRLGIRNLRGPIGKWEIVAARENFALPPLSSRGAFRYEVGDVFEHDGVYDWIHSSLTLTHFDHRKLFPKIAALLGDGGVFSFTVECWWYPRNSTQIVGRAPYICQRLTRDDLLRYFRDIHPEVELDHIREVYDYYSDPTYPTASTYIDSAAANGLHPIVVERHMNNRAASRRAGIAPPYLEREVGEGARQALANIRRFRPDVALEDLYTSHYLLAFRKVASGRAATTRGDGQGGDGV